MNDPAISTAAPTPPAPASGSNPPERTRCFTPIDADPARAPRRLGRLTPLATTVADELEATPASLPASPPPHAATPNRPALVPNLAIPFLQRVHASANPEKIERRILSATRTLAFGSVAIAAGCAMASGFLFRVPSAGTPGTPSGHSASAVPQEPAFTPLDSAAIMSEALGSLDAFLHAATADARRSLIDATEPLPDPLATEGRIAALAGATVQRERARLLRAGAFLAVLVPVTDAAGLPRTAAVIRSGETWRVDWRSVLTPEPTDWHALVAGHSRGPSVFRVLLSKEPDGAWTVTRPEASVPRLAASIPPGSRVAWELEQAIAASGGAPLSADVFLALDEGRRLNIVDWMKDKWSL